MVFDSLLFIPINAVSIFSSLFKTIRHPVSAIMKCLCLVQNETMGCRETCFAANDMSVLLFVVIITCCSDYLKVSIFYDNLIIHLYGAISDLLSTLDSFLVYWHAFMLHRAKDEHLKKTRLRKCCMISLWSRNSSSLCGKEQTERRMYFQISKVHSKTLSWINVGCKPMNFGLVKFNVWRLYLLFCECWRTSLWKSVAVYCLMAIAD